MGRRHLCVFKPYVGKAEEKSGVAVSAKPNRKGATLGAVFFMSAESKRIGAYTDAEHEVF
jgi:hypothetical protein